METAQNTKRLINFRRLCPKAELPYYRTGSPHYWSLQDIEFFYQSLEITHYYDLRTELEQNRCQFCQVLKETSPIKHVSAPIDLTGDPFLNILNASALDYANYYIRMIPHAKKVADKLYNHNKNKKNGEKLLFGCAAGKDRTGLVAMILLKKHGVNDQDILEDYMQSSHSESLTLKYFYQGPLKEKISSHKFLESMRTKKYTLEIVLDHLNTNNLLEL